MTAQPDVALSADPAGLSPWAVFAIACGGVFLVSLDVTIAIAAFPALRTAFPDSSPADLSWVLNAYTILYAALLVPAGRLVDLYGAKSLFILGIALFTLASAACGLAPSPQALIASRIVQAVGGALLTPSSLTLILAAFPPGKRAPVVGLWGAVGALAAALGPGIGAGLIDLAGWRAAFLVNLPVGLWLVWIGQARLHTTATAQTGARLDPPGVALIIIGVAALTYGIVLIEDLGWQAFQVRAAIATGLTALAGYIVWARGRANATIDLTLFRDRTYAFVTAATFVFGIAFSMMFLGAFLFLLGIWNLGQTLTGLAMMPGPLAVIPVAILGGRIAARTGHRPLLVTGGALYALAQVTLAMFITETPDFLTLWLPLQILGGVSVGLLLPGLAGAAVARLPPHRFGVGGAVNNAMRQLGAVIGTAIAVVLVGAPDSPVESFRQLFMILAVLGAVSGLLCLPVNTRPVPRH